MANKIYLAGILSLLMLTGCTINAQGLPTDEDVKTPESTLATTISKPAPAKSIIPAPETAAPQGKSDRQEGAAKPEPYDFSKPVPESAAVELSFFEDAAFVGDSRTDGFMLYSGIGCGENITYNGLTIFGLDTQSGIRRGGEKYTAFEILEQKQYGKIYLALGVNELGYYDDEGFYNAFLSAIDSIRAIQPDADIYLQTIIPLNEQKIKESNGRSYLTNEHLVIYNDLIAKAAAEKEVYLLDPYSDFVDETGALPYDASRDGVHLSKEYCQKWLEYLKTHTIGE